MLHVKVMVEFNEQEFKKIGTALSFYKALKELVSSMKLVIRDASYENLTANFLVGLQIQDDKQLVYNLLNIYYEKGLFKTFSLS